MRAVAVTLIVCAAALATLLLIVHRNIAAHEARQARRRLRSCRRCGALIAPGWWHDDVLCQPRVERLP